MFSPSVTAMGALGAMEQERRLAAESPISRAGLFFGIITMGVVLAIIAPRVTTSEVGLLNAREAHAVHAQDCREGDRIACVRRDIAARTSDARQNGYETIMLAAAGLALFAVFVPMFGGVAAKNLRLTKKRRVRRVRRRAAPGPAAVTAQTQPTRRRKLEKYWID